MALNPYINSAFITTNVTQDFHELLVIQAIQSKGLNILYLPRTIVNKDQLFLEDPLSKFNNAFQLECYLENVNGFNSSDILSKFGLQLTDSGTFVFSKKRWLEVVSANTSDLQLPNRPAEGDIIYFIPTQSYFEIKRVQGLDPFFQLGKNYTFKCECELMSFSSERFETGDSRVDDIGSGFLSFDTLNYEFKLESGFTLLLEDGNRLLTEEFSLQTGDLFADNDYFTEKSQAIVEWDITNPII